MKKLLGVILGIIVGTHLIGALGLGAIFIAKKYGWIPADLPSRREPSLSHKLARANSGIIHGVLVTAYDGHDAECVAQYASLPEPHVTAKGIDVDTPGIAADFDVFPPGTKITILQLGETFTVDDTGKAMRDDAEQGIYHLDLRVPAYYEDERSPEEARRLAHERAKQFGRQLMTIVVELPDSR